MTRAFTGLAVIAFVFGAGVSFAANIPATPASPRLQTFMMVFDGDAYQSSTPAILDNLIAEHRISPAVAAFAIEPIQKAPSAMAAMESKR